MTVQVIKPAGAGYETVLVLALCAAIVALAGAVVFVRTAPQAAAGIQAHQLDARRDLSAAEQGLYADLRVAFDEIMFMLERQDAEAAGAESTGGAPSMAQLAELGLSPFVQDASAVRRGAHRWQRIEQGSGSAYLGLSANPDLAGSMLLRLAPARRDDAPPLKAGHGHALSGTPDREAHSDDIASPDIWLNRGTGAGAPDGLDDARLLAAGWRQIAARFDAGVTRQQR